MSAAYDPKALLQIYHEAIDEPYSFLYINPMAKDRPNMFYEEIRPMFSTKLE